MSRLIDVVVIGAGHAGLAMSSVLSRRGIEHVVLERGDVAHSWRTERWDSLRLLTPNWMTRLPGYGYDGGDPDGYMSAAEVAAFISAYASFISAPVRTHTTVTGVRRDGGGWQVVTDKVDWRCRAVVMASGAFALPVRPGLADRLPCKVAEWTPDRYRNPAQLAEGGVLVVGASATGVQLAQEIQRSGRPVTLAVGEHVRLPRTYRGRDIQWWMHAAGVLDQRIEAELEPARARRVPSPQLAGSPQRATLDLNALQAEGVEIVGRLAGINDGKAQFSGSLRNTCALADLKMNRLLETIDGWARQQGLDAETSPGERFEPTRIADAPRQGLTLGKDVCTLIWATGFRPDHRWLQIPVVHPDRTLQHDRGVVMPGLYVLGLPYLRRRKSSFIHGAEDDVRELGAHLCAHLERSAHARVAADMLFPVHESCPGAQRADAQNSGSIEVLERGNCIKIREGQPEFNGEQCVKLVYVGRPQSPE